MTTIFSLLCFLGLVQSSSLLGSGGSSAERLLQGLLPSLNARYIISIQCEITNVATAKQQFISKSAHYAVTDVPFSRAEEQQMKSSQKLTLPIALQTVSIFAFIPQYFKAIKLSPAVLAKIFSGKISTWDHADILKLNPSLKVPPGQTIFVVTRKDSSGTTALFTEWLSLSAKEFWSLSVGTTVVWPRKFASATGSAGVAATMRSLPFSIGYLSTGVGLSMGLNEIFVPNKNGVFRRASNSDPSASIPRKLPLNSASWSDISLVHKSGKSTWPITGFVYAFSRVHAVELGDVGGILKGFLNYLNSNVVQGLLVEYQLSRLPKSLITKNEKAISSIVLAKGVVVPF